MRYLPLAAAAFVAMTATAHADPVRLTDSQMDVVSAGVLDNNNLNLAALIAAQVSAPVSANTVAAVGILAEGVEASGSQTVHSHNSIDFNNTANQGGGDS